METPEFLRWFGLDVFLVAAHSETIHHFAQFLATLSPPQIQLLESIHRHEPWLNKLESGGSVYHGHYFPLSAAASLLLQSGPRETQGHPSASLSWKLPLYRGRKTLAFHLPICKPRLELEATVPTLHFGGPISGLKTAARHDPP